MKRLVARSFERRLGRELVWAAIKIGSKKNVKKILKLFELEDAVGRKKKPSKTVSTVLGTADNVVDLALKPFGKRKKMSWKHMYEHRIYEQQQDVTDDE